MAAVAPPRFVEVEEEEEKEEDGEGEEEEEDGEEADDEDTEEDDSDMLVSDEDEDEDISSAPAQEDEDEGAKDKGTWAAPAASWPGPSERELRQWCRPSRVALRGLLFGVVLGARIETSPAPAGPPCEAVHASSGARALTRVALALARWSARPSSVQWSMLVLGGVVGAVVHVDTRLARRFGVHTAQAYVCLLSTQLRWLLPLTAPSAAHHLSTSCVACALALHVAGRVALASGVLACAAAVLRTPALLAMAGAMALQATARGSSNKALPRARASAAIAVAVGLLCGLALELALQRVLPPPMAHDATGALAGDIAAGCTRHAETSAGHEDSTHVRSALLLAPARAAHDAMRGVLLGFANAFERVAAIAALVVTAAARDSRSWPFIELCVLAIVAHALLAPCMGWRDETSARAATRSLSLGLVPVVTVPAARALVWIVARPPSTRITAAVGGATLAALAHEFVTLHGTRAANAA